MDKTLFELVPVSVKPDKDGWYFIIEPNHETGKNYCEWDSLNNGWYDEAANRREPTHYLRPLPPPVAEEQEEKMWLEIVHSVVAGYERMRMPIEVAEELKKRFHITKK